MKRQMRTYYYAIFGAIGGLIGWQASNLLGLSIVSNLYLSEAIVGALVGASIGLLIGVTEGVLTRNIVQVLRSGDTVQLSASSGSVRPSLVIRVSVS